MVVGVVFVGHECGFVLGSVGMAFADVVGSVRCILNYVGRSLDCRDDEC